MKFPEEYRTYVINPHENPKTNQAASEMAIALTGLKYRTKHGDPFGAFVVPAHKAPGRRQLNIIACDGSETGWEHVSITVHNCPRQTPTWQEMCFIKDLFWAPEEWVVQFHPAKDDNLSVHDGCLHLWKPLVELPHPPKILV